MMFHVFTLKIQYIIFFNNFLYKEKFKIYFLLYQNNFILLKKYIFVLSSNFFVQISTTILC